MSQTYARASTPNGQSMENERGGRAAHDILGLMGTLRAHNAAEIEALETYRALALKATEPVMSALFRILQEQYYDPGILIAAGGSFQAASDCANEVCRRDAGSAESLDLLRGFARQEGDGAAELRQLAHQAPELFGGVFALLLNLAAMDSCKHEMVLRFMVREVESAD
jgi:hypothetical protein